MERDTYYRSNFQDAVAVYKDLGFEVIHRRTFTDPVWGEGAPKEEQYLILWHSDGILATAESYGGGRTVNTTKVYYNVEFTPDADYWGRTSSGRFYDPDRGLWIGHHDTRLGLREVLDGLRSVGTFQPKWVERPFLWLLTYMDSREEDYDYDAINERVISELPEHVRNAITPEESA